MYKLKVADLNSIAEVKPLNIKNTTKEFDLLKQDHADLKVVHAKELNDFKTQLRMHATHSICCAMIKLIYEAKKPEFDAFSSDLEGLMVRKVENRVELGLDSEEDPT